ncbi:O-antigen polymerase [Spirosoma jeollabukense]
MSNVIIERHMYIDVDLLPEIFLQAALFLSLYSLLYKKYIYSIFDPLFLYVFTLSFSSVLVVNVLADSQPNFAYHFFWCQLFFFSGFSIITYIYQNTTEESKTNDLSKFNDYKTFRVILYILCALFFLTNIVLFVTKGFALLSEDPSDAKVENFTKGFGLIARINKSVGVFVLTGLFFSLYYKPKTTDFVLIIISIALKSLTGAKSAFVDVVITAALIANHSVFRYNRKITSALKLMTPLGIVGIFIVSFTVFIKESTDSEQAVLKFVLRLLYGADSTLYFYRPVNEQYFAQFRFWEYPAYLFNSILSFFRLVPGIEANGNVMVLNVIENQSLVFSGPNTPYYIEGQIYFGYYGAYLYSLVIGACFAYSREVFFNKKFSSAFTFVFMSCVIIQASAITIEASYGLTKIFETYFFVIPIYVLVNFAVHGRIKWRKWNIGNSNIPFTPIRNNTSVHK